MLVGVAAFLMLSIYRAGGTHELTGIPPHFTKNGEPPREIAVYSHVAGNNLVLPCAVTGTPSPRVTWYRENTQIDQGFVRKDGTLALRLNANDLSLQGTQYHCTATNYFGRDNSAAVLRSRSVNVTLAFFRGFRNTIMRTIEVETVVGGPVALECDFSSSNPAPDVVWYDDQGTVIAEVLPNNEFRYLHGGRYLLIRRLTSAQRARRYHCKVTNFIDNSGSHARAPTTYALNRDLEKGEFIQYLGLGTQVGRVGQALTSSYVAARRGSDGYFTHYTISCDGNYLLTVTVQNAIVLRITLLEGATTAFEVVFTCSLVGLGTRAYNISGTIRVSRDISPFIMDPLPDASSLTDRERRAGFGSGLLYNCATSANRPPGVITWYYNGEVIRSGSEDRVVHRNGTLTIQNTQISHSGIYQCFATNAFGDDIRTWILEVKEEAQILPVKYGHIFSHSISPQSNCSKEHTVLTCTDPRSTFLFDDVRPELVKLDRTNRVGGQLLTLRSNMANMTVEFNIPTGFTGVKRVELELLDCEELGISMESVVLSAPGISKTAYPLTSCDKLVKVCLSLSPVVTSRQMVLNLTTRNPLDWMAISSVSFYTEVDNCDTLTSTDVLIELLAPTHDIYTAEAIMQDSASSSSPLMVAFITGVCVAIGAATATLLVQLAIWKARKRSRAAWTTIDCFSRSRKAMAAMATRIRNSCSCFGGAKTTRFRNCFSRSRQGLAGIGARIRNRFSNTQEEMADGIRNSYSHSKEAVAAMASGIRRSSRQAMAEGIRNTFTHSKEAVSSTAEGFKNSLFIFAAKAEQNDNGSEDEDEDSDS